MRYSGDMNNYHRSSYRERTRKSRPEYIEEEGEGPEPGYPAGLFSNSQTVLILTVMVGCFGVLWPKIFSPMFFGDNSHHHDLDDHSSFGGGALFPGEHPNPAMRARMGAPHPGLAAGQGKQVPGQPPVRTIDKEWPDKHPRPGMRPTLGGPGIQQNQKQAATGGMSVVMPIYTVAILVFFIYTIVKILFKNKDKDKEEDEDDEDFLNSEYYKNHLAQQKAEQKKNVVTNPEDEGKVKSDELPRDPSASQKETKLEHVKPEKTNVVRFKFDEKTGDESSIDQDKDDKEKAEKEEVKVAPKEISSRIEITPAVADPRDIEIQLLKAKLEQTEKTLEAVLAQMAAITMPNLSRAKKKKSKKLKEILADKEENDTNEE